MLTRCRARSNVGIVGLRRVPHVTCGGVIIIEKTDTHIPLKDVCVLGRKRTVDVVIDDQRVSREHAMIRKEGTSYLLFDLDSANGTVLNGVPVARPTRLRDGDQIEIGGSRIKFFSRQLADTTLGGMGDATMIGFNEQAMLFLVADVKGYTRLSAAISESELTGLMRSWYADCQEILGGGGAIIDKFIGDCVFAYWTSERSENRTRAVEASFQLLERTQQLSDRHASLLAPHNMLLECGVGLHCGQASLGAMVRGQKTSLGDAVNLTFRLESLTRTVGDPLVLSEQFVAGWDEGRGRCKSRGTHALKGIPAPVEVFVVD